MRDEDYADIFERQDVKDAIDRSLYRSSIGILWLIQRSRCFWCDRRCLKPAKKERRKYGQSSLPVDYFTLDHVQSRWQGGGDGADNLVGACYRCNNFRNSTEHKRAVGRIVGDNQPEELRLKRFLNTKAITIPFEKGLSRRERKKIKTTCAFGLGCDTVSQVQ